MKVSIFFRGLYNFVKAVYYGFYNVKVEGKENIPQDTGFIIASNHRSFADPPLVAVTSKCSKFSFVAKEELFKNPLFGWLIRKLGAFSVVRGKGDMKVISDAVERLEEGRILVIFPEGTRSKDGKLGRGKTGVALIAAKSKAVVVPTAVVFEGKLRFRKKVTVKFGKPIQPEEIAVGEEINPKELRAVKARIMGDIQELLEAKNG
ncbi:MAG: 1-acyl-sn-glycerol-3-phosphate acyltransferase [Oscillospiraceae bacterium]|nr:1-acyl-sn-glycerol-3-phosphate acyltransferase [Oscillospiraceae bacterium]